MAHRIEPGAEERFLEVVLLTQEIRQQVLERHSLAMSPRILSGVYRRMRENYETEGAQARLLQREPFRRWMRGLNGRGGLVLLDALAESQLDAILREEAEKALATSS